MSALESYDNAMAELAWYLQHEPFNAERERELRKECEKWRPAHELAMMAG